MELLGLLGLGLGLVEAGWTLWIIITVPRDEAQTPVQGDAIIEDPMAGDRPHL